MKECDHDAHPSFPCCVRNMQRIAEGNAPHQSAEYLSFRIEAFSSIAIKQCLPQHAIDNDRMTIKECDTVALKQQADLPDPPPCPPMRKCNNSEHLLITGEAFTGSTLQLPDKSQEYFVP